ncbi:hypothetical protein GCM10009722_11740 [Williamsia deligens]
MGGVPVSISRTATSSCDVVIAYLLLADAGADGAADTRTCYKNRRFDATGIASVSRSDEAERTDLDTNENVF